MPCCGFDREDVKREGNTLPQDINDSLQCSFLNTFESYFIDITRIKIRAVAARAACVFVFTVPVYCGVMSLEDDGSPAVKDLQIDIFNGSIRVRDKIIVVTVIVRSEGIGQGITRTAVDAHAHNIAESAHISNGVESSHRITA
jgi:hypothetical protein